MNKIKKIIAIILTVSVAVSCFALSITSAFAKSYRLTLNVKTTTTISGEDDLEWFIYTPEISGVYSLLSYNVPATECYLFIKEVNKETKVKEYKQLAYAINDPNYLENEHNNRQFCLTYHLEAGVTYYYAVGWYLSGTRTDGATTVMLRCDSYDADIDYITASTDATLDYYSGGRVEYDDNGQPFFFYELSRITKNITVTIHYKDGTTVTSTDGDMVDGLSIVYRHNQRVDHWYPESDSRYNGNELVVWVLDKSYTLNIQIDTSNIAHICGVVVDTLGNPVEDALVRSKSGNMARTNLDGKFDMTVPIGEQQYDISKNNAITRKVKIVASATGTNNFNDTPIELCCYDYVGDGIINAKDFSLLNRNELDEETRTDFTAHINFTSSDYPALSLCNN